MKVRRGREGGRGRWYSPSASSPSPITGGSLTVWGEAGALVGFALGIPKADQCLHVLCSRRGGSLGPRPPHRTATNALKHSSRGKKPLTHLYLFSSLPFSSLSSLCACLPFSFPSLPPFCPPSLLPAPPIRSFSKKRRHR